MVSKPITSGKPNKKKMKIVNMSFNKNQNDRTLSSAITCFYPSHYNQIF